MSEQYDDNWGRHRDLNELKFLLYFECPKCAKELNYQENCFHRDGKRVLSCSCGWLREIPLASRFVNYDPELKKFTNKWGENKRTRAVRLTDEAWNNLEEIAKEYGVNRADLIECWARSLKVDDVTVYALEQQLQPRHSMLFWAARTGQKKTK